MLNVLTNCFRRMGLGKFKLEFGWHILTYNLSRAVKTIIFYGLTGLSGCFTGKIGYYLLKRWIGKGVS